MGDRHSLAAAARPLGCSRGRQGGGTLEPACLASRRADALEEGFLPSQEAAVSRVRLLVLAGGGRERPVIGPPKRAATVGFAGMLST